MKHIWLPVAPRVDVEITNGKVQVSEEMRMELRPISRDTGFSKHN